MYSRFSRWELSWVFSQTEVYLSWNSIKHWRLSRKSRVAVMKRLHNQPINYLGTRLHASPIARILYFRTLITASVALPGAAPSAIRHWKWEFKVFGWCFIRVLCPLSALPVNTSKLYSYRVILKSIKQGTSISIANWFVEGLWVIMILFRFVYTIYLAVNLISWIDLQKSDEN